MPAFISIYEMMEIKNGKIKIHSAYLKINKYVGATNRISIQMAIVSKTLEYHEGRGYYIDLGNDSK